MSSDLSFPLSFRLEVLAPIPTQPPSELISLDWTQVCEQVSQGDWYPTCLLNQIFSWNFFFTNPKSLGACAYANFPWVLHALGGMLTRATWSPGQPSVPGLFPKPIPSWRSMSPHFWLAERYSGSSISDTLVCWYPGIDAQESGGLCSQLHWTDRMYICNTVHETLSRAFEVADTGICLIKWMDW